MGASSGIKCVSECVCMHAHELEDCRVEKHGGIEPWPKYGQWKFSALDGRFL